jgi:uncharacterized membrane protein YvlD (DUF360 family)
MQKKIYRIIVNTLIFVAFASFMPGFSVSNGPIGKLLAGFFFGIIIVSVHDVLRFFKLPITNVFRIFGGFILVITYLYVLINQFPDFLRITKGYIGSIDFIFFSTPRFITLDTQILMIVASAIILEFCSIMVEKLKK